MEGHTLGSSWAGLSWLPIPRLARTDPALSCVVSSQSSEWREETYLDGGGGGSLPDQGSTCNHSR